MTASSVFPLSAGQVVGTVKSYSEQNGYGFLNVPGYPMDIKFGRNDLAADANLNRGMEVRFSCQQTVDGRMLATNLTPLDSAAKGSMKRAGDEMGDGFAKKPKTEERLTGQSSTGVIKSYNGMKGFGFISAVGMQEDVFFMKTGLPLALKALQGNDLQGKSVSFQIAQTDEGKVRAQASLIPRFPEGFFLQRIERGCD